MAWDLTEPLRLVDLLAELDVRLLNVSCGSPYYNPHIQRPAAYPPSDGYQPPEDPLVGVARQVELVRQIKAHAPPGMIVVGSGYSYLQEYLPHVAQRNVRLGTVDSVGLGRMLLAYPEVLADAVGAGHRSRRRSTTSASAAPSATAPPPPATASSPAATPWTSTTSAPPRRLTLREIKKAAGV